MSTIIFKFLGFTQWNKKVNPELATAVANMMKNDELKTLADLNDLVKHLSSSFKESTLQGELDDHLGYERSSQEKKKQQTEETGLTPRF